MSLDKHSIWQSCFASASLSNAVGTSTKSSPIMPAQTEMAQFWVSDTPNRI